MQIENVLEVQFHLLVVVRSEHEHRDIASTSGRIPSDDFVYLLRALKSDLNNVFLGIVIAHNVK
tara:strand:- start:659 stop:850 length:192 start_codon:yes stop_codon:yes gene_type:complete